jgi:hypothetical protein
MGIMADAWESYSKAVLSPQCSKIQRREMQKAFYAGAQGVIGGLCDLFDSDREPTDADYAKMKATMEELEAFAQEILKDPGQAIAIGPFNRVTGKADKRGDLMHIFIAKDFETGEKLTAFVKSKMKDYRSENDWMNAMLAFFLDQEKQGNVRHATAGDET